MDAEATQHPIPSAEQRADAMVGLGLERIQAGDYGNAKAMFLGAAETNPHCADAYNALGIVAEGPLRHDTAIALGRRALAMRPNYAPYLRNLAIRLFRDCQYEEGYEVALRAVERAPSDVETITAAGLLAYAMNYAEDAVKWFERALAIRPDHDPTKSDISLALLKAGHMQRGLLYHETRWLQLGKSPIWDLGLPDLTEADDVSGKTVLVHYEQGAGDVIMCARWIPELKRRGAHVIFASTPALQRLLTDQCGIDEVINVESVSDLVKVGRRADFHIPIMSLLRVMGASFGGIPSSDKPYVRVSLSPGDAHGLKKPGTLAVGVIWKTSRRNEPGWRRAPSLAQFVRLAEVPGVRLFSLHPDGKQELQAGAYDAVFSDMSASIKDFADLAKAMIQMDVIVSVDTGPLHLAGAMGLDVIFLNPFNHCWRWCKGVKAWYPNMTEVKQWDARSWDEPITVVKSKLRERLKCAG